MGKRKKIKLKHISTLEDAELTKQRIETRAKVALSPKESMPPKIMMKSQEMPEKNSKSNLSKCPTTSKWI